MAWLPLLAGERRDAALAASRAIAADLAASGSPWLTEESSDQARTQNASLGMGRAGVAVTLGYLTLAGIDHRDDARQLIAGAAKTISSVVMGPSFYGGFTGVAWALGQLSDWNIAGAANGTFHSIDSALARFLELDEWPWHIDVVAGLTGFLVYALSRLPSPDAERVIASTVRLLDKRAVELPDGVSWLLGPSLLSEATREAAPHGCYNLGVAHGTAGVIAALSEVVRTGIEEERARRLTERAVSWLLGSRLDGSWNFPPMNGPEVRIKPARLAWCYGTPGIAAVLLRAADALGRNDWRDAALQIAGWAAQRPLDESGVVDAAFCHGSAGLGHVFNRLYQSTGDERFAEVARTWFGRALEARVDGEG
ncbi:MAG TPA: lanthionine synthetase C family protein, partial [Vicinamibacterales bacterium]